MGKENPTNFGDNISDLIQQKNQQKKDEEEKERKGREEEEQKLKIKKDAEIESAKQFARKCDQVLIPIFEQLLSSMGEGKLSSGCDRDNHEEYSIKFEWDCGYDLDHPSLELGCKEISIHVIRHHESCNYSILKIFKKEREIKLIKKDALIVKELSTQKEADYVDLRWPIWEQIVSLKDADIQKKIEEWILKELHKKI